jgi:hypothetical protein
MAKVSVKVMLSGSEAALLYSGFRLDGDDLITQMTILCNHIKKVKRSYLLIRKR